MVWSEPLVERSITPHHWYSATRRWLISKLYDPDCQNSSLHFTLSCFFSSSEIHLPNITIFSTSLQGVVVAKRLGPSMFSPSSKPNPFPERFPFFVLQKPDQNAALHSHGLANGAFWEQYATKKNTRGTEHAWVPSPISMHAGTELALPRVTRGPKAYPRVAGLGVP